jgi:hypothetical protein
MANSVRAGPNSSRQLVLGVELSINACSVHLRQIDADAIEADCSASATLFRLRASMSKWWVCTARLRG